MANPSSSQDVDSINPVLLPSQLKRRRKKVSKKTFDKVTWKFSEDRPRRAGSTPYFTNCSRPAHSPGLRAAEQKHHCPGVARGQGLPGSHLGGLRSRCPRGPNRPRWLPADWRRFLREALRRGLRQVCGPLENRRDPREALPPGGSNRSKGGSFPITSAPGGGLPHASREEKKNSVNTTGGKRVLSQAGGKRRGTTTTSSG